VKALNFHSSVYHANLMVRNKCCTIRLGDKRDKYEEGDLVWVTYGDRFQQRKRIFTAVLDEVACKTVGELTEADLAAEDPEMRDPLDAAEFLTAVYGQKVTRETPVTVIYFSEVVDG